MAKKQHPNAKNKEVAKEEQLYKIARLYVEGKNQIEIGMELGIPTPNVCRYLAEVRAMWKASTLVDFDERKNMELAKLDRVEQLAWEAWFRSCEDQEFYRRRVEEGIKYEYGGNKDDRQKAANKGKEKGKTPTPQPQTKLIPIRKVEEVTRQGRCGDPRYLDQITKCIEIRCKLFGLMKIDVQRNVNQVFINWDQLAQPAAPTTNQPTILEASKVQVLDAVEARLKQEEEAADKAQRHKPLPGTNGANGSNVHT